MLLIMPVVIPFFQSNGLDMQQILFLQAVFSTSLILFEVPSGYIADVVGRKFTLVIGNVFVSIAFGFYAFAYTFTDFLIVEIALGIGSSLLSGADSALLYDTLLDLKKEKAYTQYAGRLASVANFSEGIAAIIGGQLALISLRTPLYVEAILILFSLPIALSLKEPKRHTEVQTENSFKSILRIVRYALHGHAEIKWLILYSSLVGLSTFTIVWFVQPYLQATEVPLAYFGISWAVLQFSVGIFALMAYRIERALGRKRALIILILLSSLAYLLLSQFQTLWAAPILFIFYLVRGINGPVINDYLNRVVTSDIRATVLSVKSLIGRLMFVIFGPIVGWVNDAYSLGTAFLLAGITFLCFGTFFLWRLHKNDVL